jgi:hypothetical protein
MTSVQRENKVKAATMSLSASSPDGDDRPYLEWHQLDHLPEQYQIPGLLYGQRWASTPECRAARAFQSDRFAPTNHVVQYLFGDPVGQAVDDWFTLGARLAAVGRFPFRLPAVMLAGFDVVGCHAAPSASVTPEVVPYRPNRGMYLVVELPGTTGRPPVWTADQLERLLGIDGVGGLWTFVSGSIRPDRLDQTGYHAAVCFLDGDPADVAGPVGKVVVDRWDHTAVTPEFAAPFVSVRPWDWDRFRQTG